MASIISIGVIVFALAIISLIDVGWKSIKNATKLSFPSATFSFNGAIIPLINDNCYYNQTKEIFSELKQPRFVTYSYNHKYLGSSSDGIWKSLSFFPPSSSPVLINDSACCISKIASSQKSTKTSIFSLSPSPVIVL